MIIGAGQTQGYRRTALHPLGSLDDHAYVLSDAEVTSLIIDPNPMFVERAHRPAREGAVAQADPDHRSGARGAGRPRGRRPHRRGGQVLAEAAGRRGPAARSHRRADLHRRHHRQAQGRHGHDAVDHHDDDDSARRVGVAGESAVPDVHPAVACRRGVLHADDRQGRRDDRAVEVRPGRGAADDRGAEDHRHDAGAVDDLRADGPPRLAHPRPVVAGDRLLRRVGDEPGAAARRRSTASGRSSPSTTGSPRRRWSSPTWPRATTTRSG